MICISSEQKVWPLEHLLWSGDHERRSKRGSFPFQLTMFSSLFQPLDARLISPMCSVITNVISSLFFLAMISSFLLHCALSFILPKKGMTLVADVKLDTLYYFDIRNTSCMIRQEIKRSGMHERGQADRGKQEITFLRHRSISVQKRLDEGEQCHARKRCTKDLQSVAGHTMSRGRTRAPENAVKPAQGRFEETSRHRTAPAALLGRDGGNKDSKADYPAFPCS